MPKKSFVCEICGYKTSRKFNLELHMNKKSPCERISITQEYDIENNSNENDTLVNKNTGEFNINDTNLENKNEDFNENDTKLYDIDTNKKFQCDKCDKCFTAKHNYNNHIKKCIGKVNKLQCQICLQIFNNRVSLYRHKKKASCSPPLQNNEDLNKEIDSLKKELEKKELELLKSNNGGTTGGTINNTTNNNIDNSITDNSVNDNSVTTNNTIIYNNYNKPYTGHISQQTMIDIYNDCKAEMSMMIYSLVKKIYKDHPENDSIRFPEGIKSGFAEVQYNGQKCILPANEVLETVLTKTTSIGKKKLMKAYETDDIIGHNLEDIIDEMSTLSLNFRNEKEHRGIHLPYVKSALLM